MIAYFTSFLLLLSSIAFAKPPVSALSVMEIKGKGASFNKKMVAIKGCIKGATAKASEGKRDFWYGFNIFASCQANEKNYVKVMAYHRFNGKDIPSPFAPKNGSLQIVLGTYIHSTIKGNTMVGALTAKQQP